MYKILIRTRNLGRKTSSNHTLNKENFLNFNNEYIQNLTRCNYTISNVSIYEDIDNSILYSEVNLNLDSLDNLKKDDLFNLYRYKYFNENLTLKINYLNNNNKFLPITNQRDPDIFLL
jgi:hypothetical protein